MLSCTEERMSDKIEGGLSCVGDIDISKELMSYITDWGKYIFFSKDLYDSQKELQSNIENKPKNNIILRGYLYKESEWMKLKRKRYFILHKHLLYSYKNKNDNISSEIFDLKVFNKIEYKCLDPLMITLISKDWEVRVFYAINIKQKIKWVNAIIKVLNKINKKPVNIIKDQNNKFNDIKNTVKINKFSISELDNETNSNDTSMTNIEYSMNTMHNYSSEYDYFDPNY